MGSRTTLISIFTLYNWDNTLFDNMLLPEGMDRETTIDNIVYELAELQLLYNDFDFMKEAIKSWSKKEIDKWTKLYSTTQLTYNPIENYNRTEDFTDTETRNLSSSNLETRNLSASNNETRDLAGSDNETRDLAGSDNETRDLATTGTVHAETGTDVINSGTDTVTKSKAGYNNLTATLSETEATAMGSRVDTDTTNDTTSGGTDTGTVNKALTDTGTVNRALTDTGTVNRALTDTGTVNNAGTDSGTVTLGRTGVAKGNIGVTTTQQMIEQERGVLQFNMYDYIRDEFKCRFCILKY